MHELALTQEVVALVAERVAGARVRKLVLEIGKLAGVMPDAVRFCFEVCTEATALEGAELVILEPSGLARCRDCGAQVILDQPFGLCACGSASLEWLAGEELKIKELELA